MLSIFMSVIVVGEFSFFQNYKKYIFIKTINIHFVTVQIYKLGFQSRTCGGVACVFHSWQQCLHLTYLHLDTVAISSEIFRKQQRTRS